MTVSTPETTGPTILSGNTTANTTTNPPTGNAADQSSARAIINTFLSQVGLSSLGDWAWQKYLKGDSPEQIMLEVRDTPEYTARFPAMAALAKRGEAISEASYINYESGIKQLVQRYGLPRGMYDTPDAIAKLLTNSVSFDEATQRASDAAVAAYSAPQSVRDAFAARVGVGNTTGALIGAYLDDKRALPIIEREFANAQVSGAAADARLAGVDRATADELAARGIGYQQALQGFEQVAGTQGLGGGFGETISQSARVAAQFGDAAAQTAQQRVQRGRLARFGGGGSLAEANTGVAGLGSSSTT